MNQQPINLSIVPNNHKTGRVSAAPALLIVIAGMILTFLVSTVEKNRLQLSDIHHFEALTTLIKDSVSTRTKLYEYGLMGVRSAFSVSQQINRHQFRSLVKSRDLEREFPGSLGIGFIERVKRSEAALFTARQSSDSEQNFTIKSKGEADFLYVIRSIEPIEQNGPALGFDIGQEPSRRESAEQAMRSGNGTISAPVELVQSSGAGAGFLYLLPVYKDGVTPPTIEMREQSLIGWVYMPLLARKIFEDTARIVNYELDFEILDSTSIDRTMVIYDDDNHLRSAKGPITAFDYLDRKYTKHIPLWIGGREWSIIASTSPRFVTSPRSSFLAITILGTIASVLCGIAAHYYIVIMHQTKQLAEANRWELDGYKKILDSHAVVSETDLNGVITHVNDHFCKLSGYEAEELIGSTHRIVNSSTHPPSFWKELWKSIKDGGTWNGVVCNRRKDGSLYWVRSTMAPLWAGTKVRGYISIRTDITDLKLVQASLDNALSAARSADRSKSDFLANMSHEIRTPMNGVIGMTEQLLETDLSADQQELAESVMLSAKSLLTIINDILDISKIEANRIVLDPVATSLVELAKEIEAIFRPQIARSGVRLITNFSPMLPRELLVDPVRIRQVLINLIGNALKFTPAGGVVVFQVHATASNADDTSDKQSTNRWQVLFSVSDTGIGVPQSEQARIFEAFTQADSSTTRVFGGTGLGLSISYNLVRLMGGSLQLKSMEGIGSRFYFDLNLDAVDGEQSHRPNALPDNAPPSTEPHLSILVAEDNAVNQKLTQRILEKSGHRVTVANNGLEVLECLKNHRFDLILMDIQMPLMDGMATTSAIRGSETDSISRVPIVAVTANAMSGDRERFLSAGMDGYISKPFQQEELISVISKYRTTTAENEPI